MTDLSPALSADELTHLAECEIVIERGMGIFIDVGAALMAVRNERLYRVEFGTFDEYCERRWSLTRQRAYQMIDAAEVVETILSTTVDEINSEEEPEEVPIPATESQARELAPLLDDPEKLREVWAEAVERTEGKPTAAAIRAVRQEREPAPEQPPPDYSRLDAELDAEMEGTATRFRSNFSTAMRRATEVWSFDADRIAEVYAANFDMDIERTFLREMRAFCDRVTEAHRVRQRAGLRVITGDAS
jgi:hypothetical protein